MRLIKTQQNKFPVAPVKGVYVCRGSDPVQVSPDMPLSFLNDRIVDAATAVIDFQKEVPEV